MNRQTVLPVFAPLWRRLRTIAGLRSFRSRSLMALSTAIRLLAGLATFAILARTLGPREFGFYSTILAAASLIAIVSDFGFPMQALRDVAACPNRAGSAITVFVVAKTVLVLILALIASPFAVEAPAGRLFEVLALLFGTVVASYADLILVVFRGLGEFGRETKLVTWTALLQSLLICGVCEARMTPPVIAATFLAGRAAYAIAAVLAVGGRVKFSAPEGQFMGIVVRKISDSFNFALDSFATNLSAQLDILLASRILGVEQAGIYQAAGRIAQVGLALVVIPASVNIPILAKANGSSRRYFDRQAAKTALEFVIMGGILGAGLIILGPFYVRFILGQKYLKLNSLWTGFSLYIILRYGAGALGTVLLVLDRVWVRVTAQAMGITIIVVGFPFATAKVGITGIPWLLSFSAGFVIVLFSLAIAADRRMGKC